MTRAIQVLMKFAQGCASSDQPFVSDEVKAAAAAAVQTATLLRNENPIVYIGEETVNGAVSCKYFGTLEAVRAWIKAGEGRRYRTEDLNF